MFERMCTLFGRRSLKTSLVIFCPYTPHSIHALQHQLYAIIIYLRAVRPGLAPSRRIILYIGHRLSLVSSSIDRCRAAFDRVRSAYARRRPAADADKLHIRSNIQSNVWHSYRSYVPASIVMPQRRHKIMKYYHRRAAAVACTITTTVIGFSKQ